MATTVPDGDAIQDDALGTYLRRHLTASHAAEDSAKRLLDDDASSPDERVFLQRFIGEIRHERGQLDALLERVEGEQGLVRRSLDAATELVGMAGELASRPSPGRFADLEALAIGVWGKRLLWGALLTLAEVDERFRSAPLVALGDQAERQEVELLRLRNDAIVPSLTARSA